MFLKDRRNNIAKVNEEIFALENNSDDELNIFENFASTKANIEMK